MAVVLSFAHKYNHGMTNNNRVLSLINYTYIGSKGAVYLWLSEEPSGNMGGANFRWEGVTEDRDRDKNIAGWNIETRGTVFQGDFLN